MPDVQDILDEAARAAGRVPLPTDRLQRLLGRRDRKRRNERVAAATLALAIAVAAIAVVVRVNTGSHVAAASASPSAVASTSGTPTPPPKPTNVRSARVVGKYYLHLLLISSNSVDSQQQEDAVWTLQPVCQSGGECNLGLRSISSRDFYRTVFLNAEYRWSGKSLDSYTCGSTGHGITSRWEYTFHPTAMKRIGNDWVATHFEGVYTSRAIRGCGSAPIIQERYAIRGHLAGTG